MLRLGLFRNFKDCDAAVLVAADNKGLIALVDAVDAAVANPQTLIAVHDLCEVSIKHGVSLYFSAAEHFRLGDAEYVLAVSSYWAATVKEKLQPLLLAGSGHQYFDVTPSTAMLVISVGEYDANWWRSIDG
jgi:hypothetical protein